MDRWQGSHEPHQALISSDLSCKGIVVVCGVHAIYNLYALARYPWTSQHIKRRKQITLDAAAPQMWSTAQKQPFRPENNK